MYYKFEFEDVMGYDVECEIKITNYVLEPNYIEVEWDFESCTGEREDGKVEDLLRVPYMIREVAEMVDEIVYANVHEYDREDREQIALARIEYLIKEGK